MKGKTNSATAAIKVEFINVTILSNQLSTDDLIGTSITLNDQTQYWNGDDLLFKVEEGKEYTLFFGEVEGYRTPDSYSGKAVADNSVTVIGLYETELITVTVTAENGNVQGLICTINNISHTLDLTGIVSLKIPFGVSYAISLNDKTDYITPTLVSRIANDPIYNLGLNYSSAVEKVTVTVKGINSNYKITLLSSGNNIATQTTLSATYSIKGGTVYTVSANQVSGYVSPSSLTFTAVAGNTRTIVMEYQFLPYVENPTNGVYVLDTDGHYWNYSDWNNTATADCLAIISDKHRFGFAITSGGNIVRLIHNDVKYVPSGITPITDQSTALNDFSGVSKTTALANSFGTSVAGRAVPYCLNYTFPSGKKGYLGACGEWNLVLLNRAAVVAALEKVGGTPLESGATLNYYWTSTYAGTHLDSTSGAYGYTLFWTASSTGSAITTLNTSWSLFARAFCTL